jgi:hypothetical protein
MKSRQPRAPQRQLWFTTHNALLGTCVTLVCLIVLVLRPAPTATEETLLDHISPPAPVYHEPLPVWTPEELALGGGTASPPATFDTPFDMTSATPPNVPFVWEGAAHAAKQFAADPNTPTLLALVADFLRRRLHVLDVLTSGGEGAGLYVRDSAQLLKVRRFDASRAVLCAPHSSLLPLIAGLCNRGVSEWP